MAKKRKITSLERLRQRFAQLEEEYLQVTEAHERFVELAEAVNGELHRALVFAAAPQSPVRGFAPELSVLLEQICARDRLPCWCGRH